MAGPWEKYAAESGPWEKYVTEKPVEPEAKPANMLGVPEAALSLGSSALGRFAGLVAGGVGAMAPGPSGQAASWLKGTQDALTYEPRSDAGKTIMRGVGDAASWVANRPMVKQIGQGVDAVGEASPVAGAALKSIPDLLGLLGARAPLNKAVASAGKFAVPTIDAEVAALGQKAVDAGIPLRPDMLRRGKFAKTAGGFFENDIPGAGSQGLAREEALTKNVIKTINPEETAARLTDEVYTNALNRSGGTISEIAARNPMPNSVALQQGIKSAVTSASDYGADVERLVAARARDFNKIVVDGVVDGSAFKKWNSKVLEDIRSAGGSHSGQALDKLQEVAMDAFEASMSPSDKSIWRASRQEYAVGKQLMPTVAASTVGVVDPATLRLAFGKQSAKEMLARGKAGELGDLYKISQEFMKEPRGATLPERYTAYGVMGGTAAALGAATGPVAPAIGATGLYSLANLYNRLGPKLAKAMIEKSLPPRAKAIQSEFNPSLGLGAEVPRQQAMPASPLGDLTPDWTTSPGAGKRRLEGIDASGLFPAVGEPPLVPPKGMGLTDYKPAPMSGMRGVPLVDEPALQGLTPDWGLSRGFDPRQQGMSSSGLFSAIGDERVGTTRLKGRPQMPAVPGLPGLADTAIAGKGGVWQFGEPWVDAKVSVGPEQSRLAAAPMAPGGIELSRLINMPKSANRTKLLNEFKARYPQAAEYIDQNK